MLPADKKDIIREITGGKPVSSHKIAGMRQALDWIERNTVCLPKANPTPTYRQAVLSAIDQTLSDTFGMNPERIRTKSHKRDVVLMRARAMTTYQSLTGSTQSQTVQAFNGVVDRCLLVHYTRLVKDTDALYPEEKNKTMRFRSAVIENISAIQKTT